MSDTIAGHSFNIGEMADSHPVIERAASNGQHFDDSDNTGRRGGGVEPHCVDSTQFPTPSCAGAYRRRVGSRRDSGLIALFLGFFASAWFGWAQADSTLRTWLLVGIAALVLNLTKGVAPSTSTGISAGVLLLGYSVMALIRAVRT